MVGGGRGPDVDETALSQLDVRPLAPGTGELNGYQWIAGLIEKGAKRGAKFRAYLFGHGGDEVLGSGVFPGELPKIVPNALLEAFFANPVLEHADDLSALVIGDGVVEGVRDGVVGIGGLADSLGREQGVFGHGAIAVPHAIDVEVPRWLEALGELAVDPGAQALVEPDIVPPGMSDQIAKPVVAQLMDQDIGVGAPAPGSVVLGFDQRERLAHGDQAGMLHGAPEAGHDGDIELLVRIGDTEVLLEQGHDPGSGLFGVSQLGLAASGYHVAQADVILAGDAAGDYVEWSHDQRHEIARHGLAVLEPHDSETGFLFLRGHRRVGQRDVASGGADGQLPGHLEGRLVKAWKGPAGVEGLEHAVHVPVAVGLLDPIEADSFLVFERGTVASPQGGRARAVGSGQGKADKVAATVDYPRGVGLSSYRELSALDVEPSGIEPDHLGGASQVESDGDLAAKSGLIRDEGEVELVANRPHALGQPEFSAVLYRRLRRCPRR